MELKEALKEQYHAGVAMLAECVAKCPNDLWTEQQHPRPFWRSFWRISFHTAFFTHLSLGQNTQAFAPWPGRRENIHDDLWHGRGDIEPYELPEDTPVLSQIEILDYLGFVDALVDSTVDRLDLDSRETGFSWYRNMNKLSHQLLNLRHLQGHVGQLSELLMLRDIDIEWVGKSGGLRGESK